jgi:hypothetical protein
LVKTPTNMATGSDNATPKPPGHGAALAGKRRDADGDAQRATSIRAAAPAPTTGPRTTADTGADMPHTYQQTWAAKVLAAWAAAGAVLGAAWAAIRR